MTSEFDSIQKYVNELKFTVENEITPGMSNIIRAVIVAEDHRFYEHSGVDWHGTIRAATKTLFCGRLQGGSTIEQQLVRTLRGRYELTIRRKVSEIILARSLSKKFQKSSIVQIYLQTAYFGWRANGITQAASRLGVHIPSASQTEAAALAAMLKLPMPKTPSSVYKDRHNKRTRHIISIWHR